MEVPQIMTFRPTIEEFKDFSKFINKMEEMGAHKAGLAKVIPPKGWVARKDGYGDIGHIVIPCPITQEIQGRGGVYEVFNMEPRNIKSGGITLVEFEKKATSKEYATPLHSDADDLERRYWTNIAYNPPLYGADVSGSLYDKDQDVWNVGHLQTILDSVFSTLGDEGGLKIEGVNTAYLYFGMWKSTFAWHTEDMDLYSINYLHFGAPKFWYAVPPKYGRRLERVAQMFFKSKADRCPGFLRHKCYLLSPTILKKFNVPFNKVMQEEGQFMITFPYAYHAGFNHGFNCAESTNFASERWIEYGKRCKRCYCIKEMVQIDMDCFVERYQPDKYKAWLNDDDVLPHPEDDEKRKVSRTLSLAGCAKRSGEQPSRRHPLSINFGSSPKREAASVAEEKKKRVVGVGDPRTMKRIPSRIVKSTSFNNRLKKQSILASRKISTKSESPEQLDRSGSDSTGSGKMEDDGEKGRVTVRRRRLKRMKTVVEKLNQKQSDKLSIRTKTARSTGRDLVSNNVSVCSTRVCVISIPNISKNVTDSSSDASICPSVTPPSLPSLQSTSSRRGLSMTRANQRKRQIRDDFYTPLAERVKLRRRASDAEQGRGLSLENSSSHDEAPELEKFDVTLPHDDRDGSTTSYDDTPIDLHVDAPGVVGPKEIAPDTSGKQNAPVPRRSSRYRTPLLATTGQSIRSRKIRSLKQPPKSKNTKQDITTPPIKPTTQSHAPTEPEMPRLTPVPSNRDPPNLRHRHRNDDDRYSCRDAPELECFK